MSNYNVHAGHCPAGKGAYGAVGILNESTEARKVKDIVIEKLRKLGHTVYDCTCEKNTTKQGCLNEIVKKCNQHPVDLDISIHLNAGRNDYKGDKSTGGVEVYSYDNRTNEIASKICEAISELGYRNRGAKINKNLYVLNNTKSKAILIECAFVDDKDDTDIWNPEEIATAIVYGITGIKLYKVKSIEIKNEFPYLVKIDTDLLNVRTIASIDGDIKMTVKKGEIFTITEERDGWGKLKSGAGWISLKYTKRV